MRRTIASLLLALCCACKDPPPIVCIPPPDLPPPDLFSPDLDGDRFARAGQGGEPFDTALPGTLSVSVAGDGELLLSPGQIAAARKPYIWVSNSDEGTISKVDTTTLRQVARYTTFPGGRADPSRTTVSLTGDIVVANRALPDGSRGSAAYIASEKSRCEDRNGNGQIDTFEGTGAVPDEFVWREGQAQSPDECVLWLTRLTLPENPNFSVLPRAAGFDAELSPEGELTSYVYIGLFNTSEVLRLDARSGAILKRIPMPLRPYGIVVDRDGNLWVVEYEGGLARINVKNRDEVTSWINNRAPGCAYGITADPRGYIYTSGGGDGSSCVMRFDPRTETVKKLSLAMAGKRTFPRGLALDGNNQLWIAETYHGMWQIDVSGDELVQKGLVPGLQGSQEYTGAAIDLQGNPWLTSRELSSAFRINPMDLKAQQVRVGFHPYTYSDMTGYQLRNVSAPLGRYRQSFTGCGDKTRWQTLYWKMDVPGGAKAVLRIRTAKTEQALNSAAWTAIANVPPVKGPVDLDLPVGHNLLQFEVLLSSPDLTMAQPKVSWVSARYRCD